MATGDVKRKLSAIFSADVEGYSRLMEEDELATIETLTSHKETMGKLIKQYRGRVVDSTGDNLLAEFSSVVDAVQCAVEVQQVLSAKNETLPENRRMYFRIGINLGDVVEEGERIYGDGVNVAARVESLAEGGGISISGTAYDQLGKKLPLGYEYLGKQAVKNIEKPVRVYRVLTEAEAAGKVIGEEKPKPKQLRWAAIGGVVVLILVAGALAIWNYYLRLPFEPASVDRMAFPLPDKPSIAVLPFVNISNDPKQEYLADGITENIISALSKVPKMFVIARNSTFTYKGKPVKVQKVAEDLGVRYVLEGAVQRSGDSIRITAQLIDALNARHLWSERYDRELKDIFALQDEITMKILMGLEVQLTEGEQAAFRLKTPSNLDVYLKYLQAREYAFTYARDYNIKARKIAEEIISLDPSYHMGYSILATVEVQDVWLGISKSPKESLMRAMKLAKKSIAIEDTPTPHRILAVIYVLFRKYDEAIVEAKKSLEMDPSGGGAHWILGHVLFMSDRAMEAVPVLQKAIRLNPFPPSNYFHNLAFAYLMLGKYEEAINAARQAVRIQPKNALARLMLVSAYSMLGREEEARAEASEVLRIDPNFSVAQAEKRLALKNKHQARKYLDSLRKAGLPETPPLPLPDKPSIAVLPFVTIGSDPEQAYFSDGITEEIITALSKVPKMFVIARTSSFKYKGKEIDVRTVGRELGVRYLLEGSVRKSKDQLRITAQLIDTKTGNHLWAERYDRELRDIFAVQDDITLNIITALEVKLTEGEKARLAGKRAKNLKAYLKYVQAGGPYYTMTKEGNAQARRLLKEAIALDPEYPPPYLLLGCTHYMDLAYRSSKNPRESINRAFELINKAIALDDSFAGAHANLGWMYILKERNYDKAIAQCERALDLAPNLDVATGWMGKVLIYAGRYEEAVQYCEQTLRLNPMPEPWAFRSLGEAYTWVGRYEEAIASHRKALQRAPNDVLTHVFLAAAYTLAGSLEEARAEAEKALTINQKFCIRRRGFYKNPADWETIKNALRKAGLPDCPPRRSSK